MSSRRPPAPKLRVHRRSGKTVGQPQRGAGGAGDVGVTVRALTSSTQRIRLRPLTHKLRRRRARPDGAHRPNQTSFQRSTALCDRFVRRAAFVCFEHLGDHRVEAGVVYHLALPWPYVQCSNLADPRNACTSELLTVSRPWGQAGVATRNEAIMLRRRSFEEFGYTVVVVPLAVVRSSWPLFKRSTPHRGRVSRVKRKNRRIVLRAPNGLF